MALDVRKPGTFKSAASAVLFACPAMAFLLDTSSSAYTASAFSSRRLLRRVGEGRSLGPRQAQPRREEGGARHHLLRRAASAAQGLLRRTGHRASYPHSAPLL